MDESSDDAMTTEAWPPGDVVAILSTDLMDRSKLTAAWPDASVVRTAAQLADHGAKGACVIADLRLAEASVLGELARAGVHVVAFGSHVDEATLAAASAAGVDALPRSKFFRRIAEIGR